MPLDERTERPWLIVRRLDGDGISGVFLGQRIISTLDEKFGQLDQSGKMRWIDGESIVVELFRQLVLSFGIGNESSKMGDLIGIGIQRGDLP